MKFNSILTEDYKEDLYKTRTRLTDTSGNFISPKYLKPDDQRYTKVIDSILQHFDAGALLIDFAVNPENEKEVKLEVEFEGDCIWLFSKGKPYINDSEGPVEKFDSTDDFFRSLTNSIYSINQDVDRKAVRDNLFDPESLDRVIEQVYRFAEEYPEKAKSLAHNNDQWDMEVKFRRSLRRLSGTKFPNDTSSRYTIYPAISAENRWGRIIAPKEIEKADPSLWEQIKDELGNK